MNLNENVIPCNSAIPLSIPTTLALLETCFGSLAGSTCLYRSMPHTNFAIRSGSLVDGDELNGLELWRVLCAQNAGRAQEVETADCVCDLFGRGILEFPARPASSGLALWIGRWNTLVQEQCQDLPSRHLTPVLLKMVPTDVHADVQKVALVAAGYNQITAYLETNHASAD